MSDIRPNSHLSSSQHGQSRINYDLPTHSRSTLEVSNTQYVPKIVESGYIVGPPIAYTSNPSLPSQFTPFLPVSPGSSRIDRTPSPIRASTPSKLADPPPIHFGRPNNHSRIITSVVSSPTSVVIPQSSTNNFLPQSSTMSVETVPRFQYQRCVSECKNWETKYNQLYLKYMNQMESWDKEEGREVQRLKEENYRLRQRLREVEGRDRGELTPVVKDLIERHKQSTLKEAYLLLDRYRLECKQSQR